MEKIKFSVSLVTGGLLLFTVMCSPYFSFSFNLLFFFLIVLQAGLVWMVITVLKNGKPPKRTFDQQFYEDRPPQT